MDFVMSDFSLTLVLRLKTSKIINDMAKVSIKSEKITPFGGIFHEHKGTVLGDNLQISNLKIKNLQKWAQFLMLEIM